MHGAIPDTLFHDTSERGLQGTLESQSLRPSLLAVNPTDAGHEQGSTFPAWEPHPTPQEIAADAQFQLSEISAQDFERIWQ